ncbi:MAG: class II glutamine amidotransferase [Oceanospirillaceae bacterium]|nr:class II glutamine amidotransferase [Oceanospirillaceae bacterium]
MCRWLAYSGPPLLLGDLLTRPDHSLIDQSRNARENAETMNGDGFGIGWYGDDATAAVYRDIQPAWNDANLRNLADHVKAPMFLAHVRAATGTPVQQTNCHPFQHGRWLFQHNGSIPDFHRVKRELQFDVAPDLFPDILGSTDSESLFFLALTFGLEDDPPTALARTIGRVERARADAGIERPIFFSACVANGDRLWAVRYSSHGQSRTLYHSTHINALREVNGAYEALPEGSTILVSEPLDEFTDHWQRVDESTLLTVGHGGVTTAPFAPA